MDIDYYFLCSDNLWNINDHKLLGTFLLDQLRCLKSVYMDFYCISDIFCISWTTSSMLLVFPCLILLVWAVSFFFFSSTTPVECN